MTNQGGNNASPTAHPGLTSPICPTPDIYLSNSSLGASRGSKTPQVAMNQQEESEYTDHHPHRPSYMDICASRHPVGTPIRRKYQSRNLASTDRGLGNLRNQMMARQIHNARPQPGQCIYSDWEILRFNNFCTARFWWRGILQFMLQSQKEVQHLS